MPDPESSTPDVADGGVGSGPRNRSPELSGAVRVELRGFLTPEALRAALSSIERDLESGQGHLLVDARTMTDYDPRARQLFVEWNRRFRANLSGVAVITEKTLWHMVVAAMALASGQKLRAFQDPAAGEAWLKGLQR